MFASMLRVVDRCAVCGLPLGAHDAADGPAFFTVTVMGFLVTLLAAWVEYAYEPPMWVHAALWLPLTLVGSILCLRWFKALLIGMELKTKRLETTDEQ